MEKVNEAVDKAHLLNEETQKTLRAVKKKNDRATLYFILCWSVLLLVGVIGIYRQNQIAQNNKDHIDCIIKLFVTPSNAGQTRHITDLATCKITVK